ncbi:MAG TPA: ABC transporter substrate-binding protein [Burkholderiaceae bacterium]|nr:ABC transporter substrate-binding protein [Burkholderiaceae bacterium]
MTSTPKGKLRLSVAMGDYDRTRALLDGRVQIDGVNPVFMTLSPEETFFRALRQQAFDVSELSLSSYLVQAARGQCPYIAVPVFLSRAFRHTSIWVRKDRIHTPQDLLGKRVGVPEYQLTANVWARAILHDDHGVQPRDITWVRGGIETPGRPEKIALALPADVRLEDAPADRTISDLLDAGEIDGFIAPRPPAGTAARNPQVRWLFDDPTAAAKDWYRRTGIFPIMHVVGVRRTLVNRHPWLPAAVLKAFGQAKALALDALADTSATKVTLPFVEEQLKAARETLGDDFWSYGVAGNEATLRAFLRHHHLQGLSARELALDELFDPTTYESYRL